MALIDSAVLTLVGHKHINKQTDKQSKLYLYRLMIAITNQTSTNPPSNITVLRTDMNPYQLVKTGGMIVLYLFAQLAVLYTLTTVYLY